MRCFDLNHMFEHENAARRNGFKHIAGGDEAGRGPWAGPVFAAFVILPEKINCHGINDSKKLSRSERCRLFDEIRKTATAYGIASASHEEIDALNILEATKLAFMRAFQALKPIPDFVLLDYIKLPLLNVPSESFAKGDSLSVSIAAASILAKEARDRYMEEIDSRYPGYGFASHKGYGTAIHLNALAKMGPCSIHRKTFKPVRNLLQREFTFETVV